MLRVVLLQTLGLWLVMLLPLVWPLAFVVLCVRSRLDLAHPLCRAERCLLLSELSCGRLLHYHGQWSRVAPFLPRLIFSLVPNVLQLKAKVNFWPSCLRRLRIDLPRWGSSQRCIPLWWRWLVAVSLLHWGMQFAPGRSCDPLQPASGLMWPIFQPYSWPTSFRLTMPQRAHTILCIGSSRIWSYATTWVWWSSLGRGRRPHVLAQGLNKHQCFLRLQSTSWKTS